MKSVIKKQANKMISLYQEAIKVKFPMPVTIRIGNIKDYSRQLLKKDLAVLTGQYCLYVISTNNFTFEPPQIKAIFDKKKSEKKPYHISKINSEHFAMQKTKGTKCLYVGSKEKDIEKRMTEHIGLGGQSRTTYSLYLKDWLPRNTGIRIEIWALEQSLPTRLRGDLLQIIEDGIWDEFKPLFGKKGATFNKKSSAA